MAAIDISRPALDVYRHNFGHPTRVRALESLREEVLRGFEADLWWMSPPCQPYTRRGRRRDLEDARAASFVALVQRIEAVRPAAVALENVPGFVGSAAYELLRSTLDRSGYEVAERLLCPTELGVPNRRRRFYLVASREGLLPFATRQTQETSLGEFLDPGPVDERLLVKPGMVERYRHALDVVDPDLPGAVAACFTSAYGRSPVRSGSYLRTKEGLRRFSPAEVLRLLGFPQDFGFPPGTSLRTGWRLAGNSLSVPAVRWALSTLPAVTF